MENYSNESNTYFLSVTDQAELDKLVIFLELSSGAKTVFAIAPESGPQHPVVDNLKSVLLESDSNFEPENFFYSDNSLHNFIYKLDEIEQHSDGVISHQQSLERGAKCEEQAKRKLVMAFGIDQLPISRLVKEMKQLNLGRESLFNRELVLIFWLNKEEFIEEFRNRAPDFWDWRGKVVRFEARPVFNPLFYPYLQWLIAENSHLKISGVMQVQRQVDIFLDQVYVSLQAVRRQQVWEDREGGGAMNAATFLEVERITYSPDDLNEPFRHKSTAFDFKSVSTSTKTVTQKVDLSKAVRENKYSVILGAPGAGKTTLLRYLALHFAIAKRDGEEIVKGGEAEELGKSLLPILFRIADYAERLALQPDLTLLDYLHQFYRQWEAYFETEAETEVAALLLEKMRQGECLMLLDGLDEVFDQETRRLIVGRINQFGDDFSTNKFVITSRIAGYQDVKLSDRFTEFTIEDMGSEEVEKFLYRWCRAVERAQQQDATEEQCQRAGDAEAQEILGAIRVNEGVKRLTANPLLLTILALIHRNGSRLPNRRVELYALAVKTLTEDWQLGKKLPDASKVMLKENEVIELLAPLAYWMHEEKPSGLVTQAEVEEQLAATLAELNDAESNSDSVGQTVQEFLRKVRETTGLFIERAPGTYSFMHLTFEEYFAARHIIDNDQSEILQLIRNHLHEPRWDEPILLALGYYSIHFSKQLNKLVEQLFSHLENYQPALQCGEIKIKNAASQDAVIIWSELQTESATTCNKSELRLNDLLFAGKVLTQVDINSSIRKKLIEKLVITYLSLDDDFENETIKQLLTSLQEIEVFNHKQEVISRLKQAANDLTLSEEIHVKAKAAILYVACSEPGLDLVNCVTDIFSHIEPWLFDSIIKLVAELGEKMTPALEATRQNQSVNPESQTALTFVTAMSYMRADNYEKAISLLEDITHLQLSNLCHFVYWALAVCYKESEKYDKANDYYNQAKIANCCENNALFIFWRYWGWCNRLQGEYEQSLVNFQKSLNIAKEIKNRKNEANILYNIGRTYKDWGRYSQAIAHHQQSRELYEQLGRQQYVATLWYWIADCNREWGQYEAAIESMQKCLKLRQQLEDQSGVASAYYQLGRIYQAWGRYSQAIAHYQQSRELYEQLGQQQYVATLWYWIADCNREWGQYSQAIAYHQQSRELYEQLGLDQNVADSWYWIADCNREWGQYEAAIESMQQCLTLHQQLEDRSGEALAYYQYGRIYQAWGRYSQAIAHYQQSHDLYQQVGQDESVAQCCVRIGNSQRLLAKNTSDIVEAFDLLAQAEQNIRRAIQINIAGEYKQNLAYNHAVLSLLWAERLRLSPANDSSIPEKIAQFEEHYNTGFEYLAELGQTVNRAEVVLDIARAYLEVNILENLDQAVELAQESLQIFQDYNRRKLEAAACKLLGEIHLKRSQRNQPDAETIATQFLSDSLQIYQELDLNEKATEIEQMT